MAGPAERLYHADAVTLMRRLTLVQLGILLLVARILTDLATPLLPGAFRWDPPTSVQTAEAAPPAVAASSPLEPSALSEPVATVRTLRHRRASPPPPPSHTFRPRVIHFSESSAPPASDDD